MSTTNTSYGWDVPSEYGPRGIVATPERSHVGNLVIRVGVENDGGNGWHPTAHVVLTPEEAAEFLAACHDALS